MNCLYCKKEMLAPHSDTGCSHWYHCDLCEVQYCFRKKTPDKIAMCSFPNGKYRCHFQYEYNFFHLNHHWVEKKDKIFFAHSKCLVRLNFLPDITPQNFQEKLLTLLTFS